MIFYEIMLKSDDSTSDWIYFEENNIIWTQKTLLCFWNSYPVFVTWFS